MVETVRVKLDVTQLSREKIVPRSWENRDGETVTVKEIELEMVPIRKEKVLHTGDNGEMVKTHLFRVRQTQQERERGDDHVYCGDGVVWRKSGSGGNQRPPAQRKTAPQQPTQPANADWDDDIPF